MSYTALYRKFRPSGFDDVKGQDHIVTTLKNQIKMDRIGHAYLFCGTRGTGKTSVAKIFARAVNCENPVDGSPCGTCDTCRDMARGSSMNVIEIDAASNNGVDNIREIRNEVEYSPTSGKYKVYIIDEVHMLSMGAFNALLKTLEEPPSYVIFILATTEVHKIPITILSRCQRYDFRRISIDVISDRIRELLETEGQPYEEKAVRYVARLGDGSMRDALSLLDQCIAFYVGETLTYDNVLEVLGAVDVETFGRAFQLIRQGNVAGLMSLVEEIVISGRDLTQFVGELTWYFRNLLLLRGSEGMEDVLDVSTEQLETLRQAAAEADEGTLMRYVRIFSDLGNEMKYATQKRILLEVALIKLCRPQMETDLSAVLDRLSRLEKLVEDGNLVLREKPEGGETAPVAEPPRPRVRPAAVPEELRRLVEEWNGVLRRVPPSSSIFLRKGQLSLGEDGILELVFDDEMAVKWFDNEEHRQQLKAVMEDHVDRTVEFRVRLNNTGRSREEAFLDLSQIIDMKIEQEDV